MVLTDTSPEGGGILPAGHWSLARRVVRIRGLYHLARFGRQARLLELVDLGRLALGGLVRRV